VASRIGLPADAYASHGIEYFGDVGYLKGGILFADAITTVSPTYAREILTPENGMGMDAMLRWRGAAVSGIVNGIDTEIWNPATDPHLVDRFDLHELERRKVNKRAVEARFDLPSDDGPLLCMVTRLTTQKGIDLVVDGLEALVELGARLVVLGAGDARFEQALIDGAKRYPTRVACRIGYDEGLSHLMQGGSDAILIPSRFEPCGLTQLYGLRYGCVPIVSRVGGLADTVVDANATALASSAATGIQFDDLTAHGVVEAVRRFVELQAQPEVWRALQQSGMRSDLSWTNSARRYARLYESLLT
jgi:starch synthase